MEKTIRRIERICIIGICICALVAVTGVIMLLQQEPDAGRQGNLTAAAETVMPAATEEVAVLARFSDYLPDSINYGQKLPVTEFMTRDGAVRSLDDWQGKKLILLFWGSWCPYCGRVLEHSAEIADVLRGYEDYELLLINKLDEAKGETVEKAEAYLQEHAIPFETLYDAGLTAYRAFGLKLVPTLLVLDEMGYLRYMTIGSMDSGEDILKIIRYAESGGAAATAQFVKEIMTGEDGGIHTNYLNVTQDTPSGYDVLSESQGLGMLYALVTKDQALFDLYWQYAQIWLYRDGLFSWYATRLGVKAGSNALLDDMRIYGALKRANEMWGGYDAELETIAEAILKCNMPNGRLASFYDFNMKRGGTSISLSYLDLELLRSMAEDWEGFAAIAKEAETLLRGGYISDEFPMYYSSYDYQTKKYDKSSLNTSEALIALYHAVKAGIADERAIQWLEQRVVAGTLGARYEVSGQVVKGFDYDSTAVYGLAALIGYEAGNARLYTWARIRMEKYYVTRDTALKGSFSNSADGADIIAFDQMIPLLVYSSTKDAVFQD